MGKETIQGQIEQKDWFWNAIAFLYHWYIKITWNKTTNQKGHYFNCGRKVDFWRLNSGSCIESLWNYVRANCSIKILPCEIVKSNHCALGTQVDKQLLASLGDLFGAGAETTSSTLYWMVVFMLEYPEIQRKVQKEIDDTVGCDVTLRNADRGEELRTCIKILRLDTLGIAEYFLLCSLQRVYRSRKRLFWKCSE